MPSSIWSLRSVTEDGGHCYHCAASERGFGVNGYEPQLSTRTTTAPIHAIARHCPFPFCWNRRRPELGMVTSCIKLFQHLDQANDDEIVFVSSGRAAPQRSLHVGKSSSAGHPPPNAIWSTCFGVVEPALIYWTRFAHCKCKENPSLPRTLRGRCRAFHVPGRPGNP